MTRINWLFGLGLLAGIALQTGRIEAQAPTDTASIIKALSKSFASDGKGKILVHSSVGETAAIRSMTAEGRDRHAKALVETLEDNKSVVVFRDPAVYPTGTARAALNRYLASFKYSYAIGKIGIFGMKATVDVDRNDITYDPVSPTFTTTRFQFDLSKTGNAWHVDKRTLLSVASGTLIQ